MKQVVTDFLKESIAVKERILGNQEMVDLVTEVVRKMIASIQSGGTIYIAGNGGSACDAMHFAEELVARYKRERKGIRAMHFLDPSTLTCWSNDYDYESAFARQTETFCTDKDVFVGISTSGNSGNILQATEKAREKGAYTVALTGKDGGALKDKSDAALVVPSQETDRIQESHITLIHIFCELIETNLQLLA